MPEWLRDVQDGSERRYYEVFDFMCKVYENVSPGDIHDLEQHRGLIASHPGAFVICAALKYGPVRPSRRLFFGGCGNKCKYKLFVRFTWRHGAAAKQCQSCLVDAGVGSR
jgi:hypothetical protein